jgi:hypothetical protein
VLGRLYPVRYERKGLLTYVDQYEANLKTVFPGAAFGCVGFQILVTGIFIWWHLGIVKQLRSKDRCKSEQWEKSRRAMWQTFDSVVER